MGVATIDFLQGTDVGTRVDLQETLAKGIDLDFPYRVGSGHQLAVDIGDTDAVGIDNGEVLYAAAHKAFGTPRTHSANTEEDDTRLGNTLHGVGTYEQFGAVEDWVAHGLSENVLHYYNGL